MVRSVRLEVVNGPFLPLGPNWGPTGVYARLDSVALGVRSRLVRGQRQARLPAGPSAGPWTRSYRVDASGTAHSFVSLLSNAGVPVEQISQLVGHRGTTVTELIYRRQPR